MRIHAAAFLAVAACAGVPPQVTVTVIHQYPDGTPVPAAAAATTVAVAPAPAPAPPPAAPEHKAPHWEYEGAAGPEHWGELDPAWATCGTGTRQSPIDLEELRARRRAPSAIRFFYRPTAATVVDNGHTLQVSFARGSAIEIDRHRYELVQFHVHSPSEHTVRGEHHAMELHLVHKDAAGKLAVIGVFYDDGPPAPALGYVWDRWPAEHGVESKLGFFHPGDLLPDELAVVRYDGSLTTPPCSEGVVWNVMRDTRTDSSEHLDALRAKYPMNARPVVEREERKGGARTASAERARH